MVNLKKEKKILKHNCKVPEIFHFIVFHRSENTDFLNYASHSFQIQNNNYNNNLNFVHLRPAVRKMRLVRAPGVGLNNYSASNEIKRHF